jgi:hypothetical protein
VLAGLGAGVEHADLGHRSRRCDHCSSRARPWSVVSTPKRQPRLVVKTVSLRAGVWVVVMGFASFELSRNTSDDDE